jgi:hypothetical protein
MKNKNKSKRSDAETCREIDRVHDESFQHIRDAQESYSKGEKVLLRAYKRAETARDEELLKFILSQTASLYSMAGWTSRAYGTLLKREKLFPKDLHSKLSTAQFYFRHGGDYLSTLQKLTEVQLPAKPGKLDFDACYNALALKGQALLALRKERQAIRTMKDFAEFTAAHLDKTVFFRDLYFVTAMVERKLGLRYCQNYLNTIDKTKQVQHDQVATRKLLKKVKRLLGK